MEAGQRDRRVTIQRLGGAQTPMGNEDPSAWADLATRWMGFLPQRGRERMTQFQEVGVGMELIELHFFPGLTRKDRLKWSDPLTQTDRLYDIQDIQEFPRERKQIVIAVEVS